MYTEVGKNITKYRKLNGISRKQLASKIGITSQGLYKIEKGQVSPRVNTLAKIMLVMCITPNQLFETEQITEVDSNLVEKLKVLEI